MPFPDAPGLAIEIRGAFRVRASRFFRAVLARIAILCACLGLCTEARAFTHPGIPLTLSDLATVKANLNKEPWKSGYAALAGDYRSQLTYTMQGPFAHVGRNESGTNPNLNQWRNDMIAIWNLARMWYFTQDTRYAQLAHDILLQWANTQTSFGGIESGLDLGDYAYRYGGGADILRGTWPGWTQADTDAVKNLFANVYWPSTSLVSDELGPTNKGSLNLAAALAIAVFCDDQAKFDKVVYELRTFPSTGFQNSLTNGEHGETGRDQGHSYAHLLQMSFMSEVLWKQGIDVFSERDNRLLAMGEYYGRLNLNVATPFTSMGTTDEYYHSIWDTPGYAAEPMAFSILESAYVLRKGLSAPYLEQKLALQGVNKDSFMFLKSADTSTAAPPPPIVYPGASPVGTGMTNVNISGASGSGTYSNGVWTVSGSGTDIWTHGSESFHFLYKQVTGDCTIIAKVESVQNTVGYNKAGVMIRSDLNATPACKAWVAIRPDSHVETYFHGWSEMYGGSNWEAQSYWLPQSVWWVKIERLGNIVATYASPDGTSWAVQAVGRCDNLGASPYLGICVTSMVPGTPCTATFSNVCITGGAGGLVTPPPAPFAVYASPGARQVPLRWVQSFGATSYNVLRATTSGGPYTTIASGVTNASYVDTSAASNTTYFYAVTASNSAGTSPNSPEDSVTTQPPPSAPTGVNAIAGNAQATLVWLAPSGATSYNVKRSTTNGGGYVTVANVSGNSFTDTGLANGTTYFYVVSAVSAAGEGTDSSQVSVTPVASAMATLFWSGSVSGTWDTSTANWSSGGAATTFQNGNPVVFDDSGFANTTISLSAARSPGGIVVNNASTSYTLGGGAIVGPGGLVKQGGGALTLNGANTYSGGTSLAGGTLTVGNSNALGTGALILSGDVTLTNNGDYGPANNIVVSGTGNVIRLGTSANMTLSGGISGNGALTLGSGGNNNSLYLNGTNSMTGGTITLANATNAVRFSSANAGNANVAFVFNNTSANKDTLDFGTGTISFGSMTGGGTLRGNSGGTHTISVGALGLDDTFSGTLVNQSGVIALIKVGSGTLTLSGANSYSGATTVNAGKLLISTVSQAGGNCSVANGATLGVVNASSGSSPASTLTLSGGATLELQNVASTTTPLIAASNVTVNGGCTVKIVGPTYLYAGSTYPLVSYSGQLQGSFANLQLQLPAGVTGSLVNDAHEIALSITASTIPATPATLTATSGDGQVTLSWSASAGATSYNVKRATTSGGPYTTLATVSGTSYTDTTAVNGTTYYYVVTAASPNGESSASAQTSKTPTDLFLHLKLDETSGTTAADSSGNGWDATTVNSPAWTTGTLGNAINLTSASSQYLTLPAGVVSTLDDCTFAAWVKATTQSTWQRIFDFGTGTTNYMFLTTQYSSTSGSNNRMRFAITTGGGAGEQSILSTVAVGTGVWVHVAVTLSGGTGNLYINGSLAGSTTGMTLKPSSLGVTTQNYIGKSQYADPYFNGIVDDFRIYRRALSSSEIAALVAGPPAAPQNITATGGASQVALSWDTAGNATSYTLRRSASSGGPYDVIASSLAGTSYTDSGLADGSTWSYTVASRGVAGEGAASTPVSATTYTALESWRQANFGTINNSGNAADGADPDGDGLANAQEFAAGTNPNNAVSALRVSGVTISGNDVLVSFASVAGKTYRLERSDTLQGGSWTPVLDNIAGTSAVITVTDVNAASQSKLFYRVIVP